LWLGFWFGAGLWVSFDQTEPGLCLHVERGQQDRREQQLFLGNIVLVFNLLHEIILESFPSSHDAEEPAK
jgi:hypothetical protein